MDAGTKQILEDVRTRVPRYLFRAWNDTPSESGFCRLSGGHQGLNTPEAVTPLAFSNGGGHSSVYDMTKEHLTAMAKGHLTGQQDPETELSSWAASLSFALNNVAASQLGGSYDNIDNAHIAIIDTKELWHDAEIFYVPHLDFLETGSMNYPHEYLAHGVIQGPAYKAVPMRVFKETIALGAGGASFRMDDGQENHEIGRHSIERARKIADQYGGDFVLPMFLAVLCRKKRDSKLFREGVEEKQFNRIMDDISDLEIPEKWHHDQLVDREYEINSGFGDVEQLCRLIYALTTGFTKRASKEGESGDGKEGANEEQETREETGPNEDAQEEEEERNEENSEDKEEARNMNADEANDDNDNEKKYANAAQARAAARVSAKRHEERMSGAELEGSGETSKVRQAKEKAKRLLRPAR